MPRTGKSQVRIRAQEKLRPVRIYKDKDGFYFLYKTKKVYINNPEKNKPKLRVKSPRRRIPGEAKGKQYISRLGQKRVRITKKKKPGGAMNKFATRIESVISDPARPVQDKIQVAGDIFREAQKRARTLEEASQLSEYIRFLLARDLLQGKPPLREDELDINTQRNQYEARANKNLVKLPMGASAMDYYKANKWIEEIDKLRERQRKVSKLPLLVQPRSLTEIDRRGPNILQNIINNIRKIEQQKQREEGKREGQADALARIFPAGAMGLDEEEEDRKVPIVEEDEEDIPEPPPLEDIEEEAKREQEERAKRRQKTPSKKPGILERIRARIQEYVPVEPPREQQQGFGKMLKALYTEDIDKALERFSDFIGTFARNNIELEEGMIPQGLVYNTDPSDKPGKHWCAVYISPTSIEFYDPQAESPSEDVVHKIVTEVREKLDLPWLLKIKINNHKQQMNTTDSCGWHCIRFLMARFKGIPFQTASLFDESKKQEKMVFDMFA